MRISTLILVAALLPTAGMAQIEIWPGVTNFTSRGSIGNNASGGELLQSLNTNAFTGIGDTGANGRITGFGMLLQDQNTVSQEDYYVVYRSGSDATGPGPGNTALNCEIGPFTSPAGTGGVAAWNITENFGKIGCLNLCDYNAFGVRLTVAGGVGWSADGLSCHMSRGDGTFAQTVQNAASSAPDMAFQIIDSGSGPVVTNPSLKRSWRFRIITDAATLQMGNGGAVYGQGGIFPDVSTALTARARYDTAAGVTNSLLFVSAKRLCPGIKFQPGMRIYIDPSVMIGPFAMAPTSGEAIHTIGTTPATSPSLTVHLQAVGVTTGNPVLTNAVTTNL